jgi:type IV secretion system protein VirB7
MLNIILMIAAISLLFGSSTAGTYVTNISSAGNVELAMESCAIELNPFLGTLIKGECAIQNSKLRNA